MKKTVCELVFLLCLVWPLVVFSTEAAGEEELLPDLVLTTPDNLHYKEYLGLTGETGSSFAIKDIKADILLIELFSMYCPYCQKEAPSVNELFEKMQEMGKNGPVVKIIGLGASNSQFEVEHFRDTYNISFPLFPDQDLSMYKSLSGAGTPTFIGCRLKKNERPAIVLRKSGGFFSSTEFLQELIEKANHKQE